MSKLECSKENITLLFTILSGLGALLYILIVLKDIAKEFVMAYFKTHPDMLGLALVLLVFLTFLILYLYFRFRSIKQRYLFLESWVFAQSPYDSMQYDNLEHKINRLSSLQLSKAEYKIN